jgi:SAM-dependent methyltransferase
VHFDPPGVRDFSDLGATHEGFWRFYAEAGGGVWETIWPLLAVRDRGSLLDVGCGLGFALDFWQRTGRGSAVGVELADYGAAGARELRVTIHRERLEDCEPLRDRRFDVVYASEVVEHVEDPRAFCALLAPFVAEDGVLVITTPAAEYIAEPNRGTTLLTALAPGFHGFLLSARALEDALRRAGFGHVDVRRFNERMIAWASRRPIAVDFDEARLRGRCYDYMKDRIDSLPPTSPVALGYAYRLLRDWCNSGRLAEARAIEQRLRRGIEASHGGDALEPSRIAAACAKATSLDDVGRSGPYFLSCYPYFAGALAQHVDRDYALARTLYAAAADCARSVARVGVVHLPEVSAIYWPARIADATLALALGDDAGAASLAEVADRGHELRVEQAFGTVGGAQVEALLPAVAEELMARGRASAARTVADAYARYVVREYGAEAASLEGLRRADGDVAVPAPADPAFAPFHAAHCAVDAQARSAALGEFVRVAEALKGRHASRARALAIKARQAAGMPPAAPAFAFEMSFKLGPPGR